MNIDGSYALIKVKLIMSRSGRLMVGAQARRRTGQIKIKLTSNHFKFTRALAPNASTPAVNTKFTLRLLRTSSTPLDLIWDLLNVTCCLSWDSFMYWRSKTWSQTRSWRNVPPG